MLHFLVVFLSIGLADVPSDLQMAADEDLPEHVREQAFARLVAANSDDKEYIAEFAVEAETEFRERWIAIRALGQIRGQTAKQVLPKLLQDKQPAIRTAAASALGDVGSWDYSAPIASLLQDKTVVVRAAAAEALGKIGDPSVISQLETAISSKQNYYRGKSLWVRKHFVLALGNIKHRNAYPVLLKTLDDKDTDVVDASINALETIAGFNFDEGRTKPKQIEAWRRWINQRL